jgi:hypothetical protein
MLKIDESVGLTGQISSQAPLLLKETLAATADVAAYGQIWVKQATPNQLWFTNDAGNDIQLTSGTVIAASQTLYHYTMHNWYANGSANVYIPWGGSVTESGFTSDSTIDDNDWIAPFDGKIVEAKLYSDSDTGSTDLKLRVNGTDTSSLLSGGAVNCSTDKTVYTFTCDQNNTFSSGDVLRVKIENTNAPMQATMSIKWEIT